MISLIEAIQQYDIVLLWVAVAGILIEAFHRWPKLRHRRYSIRIVPLTIIAGLMVTLALLNVTLLLIVCLFALYVPLAYILYRTTKKPIYPLTSIIKNCEKLLHKGDFSKLDKILEREPWYAFYTIGKLEWNKSKARKLSGQDRHMEAYQIYAKLLNLRLFQEEIDGIKLNQVNALLQLGATLRARAIFKQVSNSEALKDRFEILSLQSIFDETTGEFEKGRQSLLEAIAEFDEGSEPALATVYNNLARMERMLSNTINVIYYYKKSAKLAKDFQRKNLIHIVYPNLINSLLLNGDRNEAKLYLDEYSGFVDPQNVDDLLKLHNYKLEFARQVEDKAMFVEALEEGRAQILPMISSKERLFFEVMELRIRSNNQIGLDEQLLEIQHYFSDYSTLELPEKYRAFKEIFIILEKLFWSSNLGSYRQMFECIWDYFEKAPVEIENYILSLPDYCVDERCYWENERVFLRRFVKGHITQEMEFKNIRSRLEELKNIKGIHIDHGNHIEAIEAGLNIVDEAMACIANLKNANMKSQIRDIMQKQLRMAIEEIENFKVHPATNVLKIRAARYALFLNDRDVARHYFEGFRRSGVSIYHYAHWLQQYYDQLAAEFHGL